MNSYRDLQEKVKNILQFQSSTSIVNWDMLTMIPPRAHPQRADQLALMTKILHQMITDPEIGILLTDVEKDLQSLDQYQQRETELIKVHWKVNSALPEKFVNAEAKQRAITTSKWNKAKSVSDWKIFQPELEKLLILSRKRADYLMEPTGTTSPYDALLDIHEPDMTSTTITKVFTNLRKSLVPLAKKYTDKCQEIRVDFKNYKVPIENQRKLVTNLVNYIGFDTVSETAGGRIDESAHPFTSSYFDDTRMTVHYYEDDVFQAIFGGLHEAGHSIQGQSRNPQWKWMFLGEKSSSGINESQARFIENIVGRSHEFWEYYYERLHGFTKDTFKDVSLDEFVKAANIIKPDKIRVTADEMTYALHIIIRYEIELDLFSGKLEVADIPQVWNEKYEKYLGVEIENDVEGALQDTHWAWGFWGYFPSYTLGNIYSGMILETLESEVPEWKEDLSKGNVVTTVNWLKENVHFKANLYNPEKMMEVITGKKLTAQPFKDYIEKKYAAIFD